MKLDGLLLQSGEDVPFPIARVTIHQPRMREIGLIGEPNFHIGSHFLLFDKNNLSNEDKSGLENQSDFHIFMSAINSRKSIKDKTNIMLVLTLLFPEYKIKIEKDKILLQSENISSNINEQNFNDFKEILSQIFCLGTSEGKSEYNPADALAARIAEKIKKARQKRDKKDKSTKNLAIFDKYISVLSVGLQKDKNELKEYTIYQLRDEYDRFISKINWDYYVEAKRNGAKDLEEVKNWMIVSE
jgi:hypothetical protein